MNNQGVDKKVSNSNSPFAGVLFALLSALCSGFYSPLVELICKNGFSHYLYGGFAYLGSLTICLSCFIVLLIKNRKDKSRLNLLSGKKDWIIMACSTLSGSLGNILLLTALNMAPASEVSLYSNFELVFTTLLAFFIFKEVIKSYSWVAVPFIACGAILLSLDFSSSDKAVGFSMASLVSMGSALCWALENNFSRLISTKNSFEIASIKSAFNAFMDLTIGFGLGGTIIAISTPFLALGGGVLTVSFYYVFYLQGQQRIGSVKTSCFFTLAPFIGSVVSLMLNQRIPEWNFYVAFTMIAIGQSIVAIGTLRRQPDKKSLNKPVDK
ncbi:MAG: DMT family transporter [Bacilli bacterium]|jgi:drug/metabolite transporter (DMT)-like permease